jgi:hypothetical protein
MPLPGQRFAHMEISSGRSTGRQQRELHARLGSVWNLHGGRVGPHLRLHPAWVCGVDLDLCIAQLRRKIYGEGV